jgi:cytochrome c biogenesis protein
LTLAVTSIIGTLIPQNESPEAYVRAYGEYFYRLFDL